MTGAIRKFFVENPSKFDPREFLKPAREAAKLVCKARFEAFGTASNASKIKPVSLDKIAAAYKSGAQPDHPLIRLPGCPLRRPWGGESGPERGRPVFESPHGPSLVCPVKRHPWSDVIAKAPTVAQGARKLWQKVGTRDANDDNSGRRIGRKHARCRLSTAPVSPRSTPVSRKAPNCRPRQPRTPSFRPRQPKSAGVAAIAWHLGIGLAAFTGVLSHPRASALCCGAAQHRDPHGLWFPLCQVTLP